MGRNSSKSEHDRTRIWLFRKACGLTQAGMAELLGLNLRTIQKLEEGKLGLSPDLAEVAYLKTAVSKRWLLGDGPAEQIVAENGAPFTEETFSAVRRRTRAGENELMSMELLSKQLEATLRAALNAGRYPEAEDYVFEFLAGMREEFGYDRDYLVEHGGPTGVSLLAGEIARDEVKTAAPTLKSAQQSLLAMKAVEIWNDRHRAAGTETLGDFRKAIRESVQIAIYNAQQEAVKVKE